MNSATRKALKALKERQSREVCGLKKLYRRVDDDETPKSVGGRGVLHHTLLGSLGRTSP
jgi:hypothetical protein